MSDIGKNIRKHREAIGMSQEEFGIQMGKSGRQTVSNWETGKNEPTLSDIKKIAEILKTSVSQLLGEAPPVADVDPNTITISKDEFIELQRKALRQEEEKNKKLENEVQQLKNG